VILYNIFVFSRNCRIKYRVNIYFNKEKYMKIPQIGRHETISHLQKSNNSTKIAANNETKIQKDIPNSIPKGTTSKIDFKA